MYKSMTAMAVFLAAAAAQVNAADSIGSAWSYTGSTAPAHWANLDAQYAACEGQNQSPINISETVNAALTPLEFSYEAEVQQIIQNEHTLQLNVKEGAFVLLDGQPFQLKQFHIHTPSENTLLGKQYPMELHLVHVNAAGELAVVALMYEEGSENQALKTLQKLAALPQATKKKVTFQAASLLPKQLEYYRFNGSLTTPPCTEGVRWIVLKDIQQASKAQLQIFSQMFQHGNSRPVQPQNARLVLH